MNLTEKTCFKCHVTKPVTDFYAHPAMSDGRLNKCKECTRKDVRANYRANIEHFNEYERSRANLPHRIAARKAYADSHRTERPPPRPRKEIRKCATRKWIRSNPLKRAAHVICGNAIRDGKLIRQPCEVCGSAKVQAHHDDYNKPLDVRWLCTTHHAEWHKHNTPKCPDQSKQLGKRKHWVA